MSAPKVFTPRTGAEWARQCAAALPRAAAGLYESAKSLDPADAFIYACDRLSPGKADAAARRAEGFDSFAGAVWVRKGGFIYSERDKRGEIIKVKKKWVGPVLIRSRDGEVVDFDDPLSVLQAVEAAASVAAAIEAGDEGVQRLGALAELDEADTAAIAARDGCTTRRVQQVLKAQRDLIEAGQGVLL